jgi:hypothetical protein
VAGLLVVVGAMSAQQAVAAGWTEASTLAPVKAKPGGTPGGFTLRLPDGRILHFTFLPVPGAGPHHHKSGDPSSGPTGSATPTGSPSGTPSASPSGDPSLSGLPVPVVSPLFPSPSPSGSHKRSTRPSHGAAGRHPSSTPPRGPAPARSEPAQDHAGADAVTPGVVVPERPASTVPPPLGPQALLHPDTLDEQAAAPHSASGGLGHRARLLGVGLALIGTGAALFGWRIRRL